MLAIACLLSLIIALFVYWSTSCNDPETGEYRFLCKACHRSDICDIRWRLEELNDEYYLLESSGYELKCKI